MGWFVTVIGTAMAVVGLIQAVQILKTGDPRWFFIPRTPVSLPGTSWSLPRLSSVLFYAVPSCAILCLLAVGAFEHGQSLADGWENLGMLAAGVFFFAGGLSVLVWPGWTMKGVHAAYPDSDRRLEGALMTTFVRVLGAVLAGVGLFVASLAKSVQ